MNEDGTKRGCRLRHSISCTTLPNTNYYPSNVNQRTVSYCQNTSIQRPIADKTSTKDYEDALNCSRLHVRRKALSDPFRLLITQDHRERIESDVEARRKSIKNRISNFVTTTFNLDKEQDLF